MINWKYIFYSVTSRGQNVSKLIQYTRTFGETVPYLGETNKTPVGKIKIRKRKYEDTREGRTRRLIRLTNCDLAIVFAHFLEK